MERSLACAIQHHHAPHPARGVLPESRLVSGDMSLRNHYGAGGNGLAQDFLENHAVDLHELERGGAGQQQMNPALSAEPSAGGLIQESRQIDG